MIAVKTLDLLRFHVCVKNEYSGINRTPQTFYDGFSVRDGSRGYKNVPKNYAVILAILTSGRMTSL